MKKMREKNVDDALHMLLHCALKDKECVTQPQQYEIVYIYILALETKLEGKDEVISKAINYIKNCKYKNKEFPLKDIFKILKGEE